MHSQKENSGGNRVKQRDLVLVEIPYSNHLQAKVRPAVVVSNNSYNQAGEDIVVCGISSVLTDQSWSVIIDAHDTLNGNLPQTSRIRADKIIFFEKKCVKKRFDELSEGKFDELLKKIQLLVSKR